jgi:hypothetical protein
LVEAFIFGQTVDLAAEGFGLVQQLEAEWGMGYAESFQYEKGGVLVDGWQFELCSDGIVLFLYKFAVVGCGGEILRGPFEAGGSSLEILIYSEWLNLYFFISGCVVLR